MTDFFGQNKREDFSKWRDYLKLRPGEPGGPTYTIGRFPLAGELLAAEQCLADLKAAIAWAKEQLKLGLCRAPTAEEQENLDELLSHGHGLVSSLERLKDGYSKSGLAEGVERGALLWFGKFARDCAHAIGTIYARAAQGKNLKRIYDVAKKRLEQNQAKLKGKIAVHDEEYREMVRKLARSWVEMSVFLKLNFVIARGDYEWPKRIEDVVFLSEITQAVAIKFGVIEKTTQTLYAPLKAERTAQSLVKPSDWAGEEHARMSHRTVKRYNI